MTDRGDPSVRHEGAGLPRISVGRNVVANSFATGWTAILGLAVLPFNVRFLGVEAYGLLGVYATFLALALILDVGLSPTVNRELARLSTEPGSGGRMRTLVRSLEVVNWGVAMFAGAVLVLLAPVIARYWLDPGELSPLQVEHALMLMGPVLAVQWPASLYSHGMQGLQAQVRLSYILAAAATLRGVGGVLVLWLVSPTIYALLLWHGIVSSLHTVVLGMSLWNRLPASQGAPARFEMDALRRVWRFAAGVTGNALLRILVNNADRIVLSRLLPLQTFGYYTLAATLAGACVRLVEPVSAAFFPRLAQLVGADSRRTLTETYHRACQLASVILLPAAVMLMFFAHQILLLWTGDRVIADEAHLLVAVLVAGSALNGLMYIPYGLQLVHGWTRLAFVFNGYAVLLLLPALVLFTRLWGAVGAASVWVLLNASYILIQIPLMHRRVLRGEAPAWYLADVGAPLAAALAVAAGGWMLTRDQSAANTLLVLPLVGMGAMVAAAMTIPWLRDGLSGFARRVLWPARV
jgi:O-antigen/teichoic acid export membrane protein